MGCKTYDGRDGKVVLLAVLEELVDVLAVDDAGLPAENVGSTHDDGLIGKM